MTYLISAWTNRGAKIAELGTRGSIEAARQAMLDHAKQDNLPDENPWHGPELGIAEGWFIGTTEYIIRQRRIAA